MSRTACIAYALLLGLVAGLSVAGCSRPGFDLTEEQKRGLEVLARVANPDPLLERFAVAHNGVCERGMDSGELTLMDAVSALIHEMQRRKEAAGGKVYEVWK